MTSVATEREVEAWWRRWPDANVGVVTGVVSGLAVLDVDPRNGGDASLERSCEEWGALPETVEVRSGGGGRHLWFDCLGEAHRSGPLAPGVDLKAEGSMVVAPPSMHASGGTYSWRDGHGPDEIDPAPLPDWLGVWAHELGSPAQDRRHDRPLRTAAEQAEFASTWARAGVELRAGDHQYLCPFHPDHHPSLHVDAEGCRWYCFGCGLGGGIGRLLEALGEPRRARRRARLRATVGRRTPITLQGDREVAVVGESRYQDDLLQLAGGERRYGGVELDAIAELVPEPDNPYDPAAVQVRIDGRPVGYLRHADAVGWRETVDDSLDLHRTATCRAVVRGGWDRGSDDIAPFGVTLLLPRPID